MLLGDLFLAVTDDSWIDDPGIERVTMGVYILRGFVASVYLAICLQGFVEYSHRFLVRTGDGV